MQTSPATLPVLTPFDHARIRTVDRCYLVRARQHVCLHAEIDLCLEFGTPQKIVACLKLPFGFGESDLRLWALWRRFWEGQV